jgi:hypothetical protein
MNTQTKPGATKFIATNKHAISIASSTFHGRPDLGWLNLGDKARRLALEIEAAINSEISPLLNRRFTFEEIALIEGEKALAEFDKQVSSK